jgi:hypothetical protein
MSVAVASLMVGLANIGEAITGVPIRGRAPQGPHSRRG